jgi:tetratricopeptide (TPR) repeat protein
VLQRFFIAGTAAALVAAVLALGGLFHHATPTASASDELPAAVVAELAKGFAAGNTEAEIAGLQGELRIDPNNQKALDTLGLAYEQRVRETGDATYYTKAEGILREAVAREPRDLIATAGLGSLALSRHRFRTALALGRRAQRISPTTAGVYGVIGDAELELGRYRQAFRSFDHMNALKPSVSSYSRVSYARELIGHIPAAEHAMSLAASAAVGEQEASSWTHTQLGLLYLGHAQPRKALAQLETALTLDPTYYIALDGMAQVQAGLGRVRIALAYEKRAVDAVPLPAQVGLLGDLYRATGDPVNAKRQYALIGVIEKILAANGVKNDLDVALFDADHGIALPHALTLARKGYVDRPSIFGDDVLGWVLARNGRCGEARAYSNRSLRLGTQDALKFFHRGWIAACLGRKADAAQWYRRALALNPRFSVLWAPVAEKGSRR